jgi:undecaprenyl-diphosphatase
MPLSLLFLVAIIQGITEFLPVSSSGHLALIPLLTDQPYQGRVIDVAAHVGTFFAVAFYLRVDLMRMIIGVVTAGRRRVDDMHRALLLVIATIPAIIAGFIINKIDPAWLLTLETLAIANLVFAMLLWLADRFGASLKDIADIRLKQALIIGFVQISALIPGASRSGVTMTAARFLGFDRLSAARFSLLLSLPVIAGAGTLKTFDMIKTGDLALGMDALIVAILSCLFALIAIRVMMNWLARANFTIFVGYRLALGALLLLALQMRWL